MAQPRLSPQDDHDGPLSLTQIRDLIQPVQPLARPLPSKVQVVIVGAGPAGLTAANLLGKMGVATLLLDARTTTSEQPKAIAIDDEYMRLLASVDLEQAMAHHHSAPFGIWFMGADRQPVIKVAGAMTPNGFGRRSAIMQPVFEKILLAGATSHPSVQVCLGVEVSGLTQNPNGVTVRAGAAVIECDYVLACDGARSAIRSALGIGFVGTRIDEPHLVVDLADFPDQSPYSRFFCDPRRPLNSVPSVYGGRRIEFMLNPADDRDYLLSDVGIRELVDRHTPYKGVELHIIRRAIYGFSEKIADCLHDGRVFLLGDAAHVMPPFGGQGMNTAARDANNLCWKIAKVLNGMAPASLLDTYDAERRPQISAIVKYSVLIGRFANVRSRPLAYLRDAILRTVQLAPKVRRFFSEMRYMPRPAILRGLIAPSTRFQSFVGVTFPRWSLLRDSGLVPVDELAGNNFCLLGIGVGAQDLIEASQHRLWRDLAPTLAVIGQPGTGQSPGVHHGSFAGAPPAEAASLQGTICVIRPDRYVAAVTTPGAAAGTFDTLYQQLQGGLST